MKEFHDDLKRQKIPGWRAGRISKEGVPNAVWDGERAIRNRAKVVARFMITEASLPPTNASPSATDGADEDMNRTALLVSLSPLVSSSSLTLSTLQTRRISKIQPYANLTTTNFIGSEYPRPSLPGSSVTRLYEIRRARRLAASLRNADVALVT